jgi:hypothetical protein
MRQFSSIHDCLFPSSTGSCMVNLPMVTPKPGLESLTRIIASRMDEDGSWRITSDETMAALGVAPVEYWRALHCLREKIHFFDAVDGFSQDSVGELVTLAEQLAGPTAEAAMVGAGLFLPHPARGELAAELLARADAFSASHVIGDEELASMLRYTGSVRRTLGLYLDEHADLDILVEESARAFAEARGMPAAGARTAARFLRELFSRHIMEKGALFASLERRLRQAAGRLGFADPEEHETRDQGAGGRGSRADGREGGGARPVRAHGRLAWARGVLGLPDGETGSDTLRRRYRELIMRYHPDVNPSGLERCKDITAAYSVLAARAVEGDDS